VIVGVGIDVCDVSRFAEVVHRRPGLVHRLFTPAEAERPVASQAARFAAKEALAKALGAPSGMSWLDAEILTDRTRGGQHPRLALPRRGDRLRRRRLRGVSMIRSGS